MFINTGGLPEHHRPHGGGELHQRRLQPQRHHHGHGHLQQLGQLHLPHRSGRLTASGRLLPPAPRHHGDLSPAPLLLKPGLPPPPTHTQPHPPSSSPPPTRLPSQQPRRPSPPLHRTEQRPQD